jgi:nitrate reductase assembly molybdenum cofactor insertion protein NarJ
MVDLIKTYEAAGLFMGEGELPDHLTVVLEYASTQPPAAAREFLREISHILQSSSAPCSSARAPTPASLPPCWTWPVKRRRP